MTSWTKSATARNSAMSGRIIGVAHASEYGERQLNREHRSKRETKDHTRSHQAHPIIAAARDFALLRLRTRHAPAAVTPAKPGIAGADPTVAPRSEKQMPVSDADLVKCPWNQADTRMLASGRGRQVLVCVEPLANPPSRG